MTFFGRFSASSSTDLQMVRIPFRGCTCLKCTNVARTDCLLVKFNNGLNGLNGFVGCVISTTD